MLQSLKNRVERAYAARRASAVVVGSLGRAGSSMLTRACAQSLLGLADSREARQEVRRIIQPAWSLDQVTWQRGVIYKTHDYPDSCPAPPRFARFLYTYADPIDVVVSLARQREVRGLAWLEKHAEHMKVTIADFDRLFVEDIFDLERHFEAWIGCTTLPLIALRYDRLWAYRELISDFLRFELHLPPYAPREALIDRLPEPSRLNIQRTYGRLRDRIAGQPLHVSPPALALLPRRARTLAQSSSKSPPVRKYGP